MPTPHRHQGKEQPSTYFVQDRHNEEELTRLHIQDQTLTAGMGGVLPEQPDPSVFRRVLDVGCGTGDWLISAAKTYPSMTQLVGIDISKRMVDYARAQAEEQQVSDRVEFHVMDTLLMLEFPYNSFDLVNQRLGASYLRTWDWSKLLQEFQRISRRGAVIRLTEADLPESNSPAFSCLNDLAYQALYRSGHLFTQQKNGVTSELAHVLQTSRLHHVQIHAHTLEYRAGTTEGASFVENMKRLFRTMLPFLRKWTSVPDDYEQLYQQMLSEMQQPDFVATLNLLTACGVNPQTHQVPRRD